MTRKSKSKAFKSINLKAHHMLEWLISYFIFYSVGPFSEIKKP